MSTEGTAEAFNFLMQQLGHVPACSKTVAEVLAELVSTRKARGIGERHLETLRLSGSRFARHYNGPVSGLTTEHLQTFLDGLEAAPRTKNNYLAVVRQLASFAKRRKYLPGWWDEFQGIEKHVEPRGEPEFYRPAELAAILAHCPPSIVPAVCLVAFAGVRVGEVCRMGWEAVNWEAGITVTAAKAKTRSRRVCPLTENLRAWLAPFRGRAGRICDCTRKTFNEHFRRARLAAGVTGRRNGLRHAFVSYRLADIESARQVSLEAGHSEAMLFAHYRALVTKREARDYFAIFPVEQPAPFQLQLFS